MQQQVAQLGAAGRTESTVAGHAHGGEGRQCHLRQPDQWRRDHCQPLEAAGGLVGNAFGLVPSVIAAALPGAQLMLGVGEGPLRRPLLRLRACERGLGAAQPSFRARDRTHPKRSQRTRRAARGDLHHGQRPSRAPDRYGIHGDLRDGHRVSSWASWRGS